MAELQQKKTLVPLYYNGRMKTKIERIEQGKEQEQKIIKRAECDSNKGWNSVKILKIYKVQHILI